MRTFTTLFDINYLDKAIALYESINKFLNNYRLYCLCLDNATFDRIVKIHDKRLIPMYINSIFRNNKDFKVLTKNNKAISLGQSDFHFALGSFFTHYIMEKILPEDVLYVDSDIVFYCTPSLIFDAMKNKSIGVVLHRHNEVGVGVGGYNVGIVYFRNNGVGRRCLQWWRDVVMDKTNQWFSQYGFCGDQKYLELFESMFGNVKVLDDDIGHAAPWNFRLYKYFDDPTIIEWKGKIQPLVFIHYSHFSYTKDSYRIARGSTRGKAKGEWSLYAPAKRYYDEYFETLKSVKRRYKL